uniref:Integrase, catalytic region, zinc finger, CCHC-type, peptidase aspartic, catalytic n=1 Tax=Tanacetum cinerariifolium TaxID=118510 RepID=A0A6L2L375_TANCI|nr:integrase, catalytic region, zinc finger, CCHC-type, peptidase aspartic, catalytic [Tanacetum cinerariifolium]
MGTVRFKNDHVVAILGFGDLQWGNILITRVYFIEGLGHNLFSVWQFCDSDLEVAFRRNACFVRNLEGVDLLKGDRSTNLYTINLHEMAFASPICLMARASSTKSWLWHQRLSHLNFDTINDLARNDLVSGLLKFKYNKEHLCPSCEQRKSKRASHPPKPVPNSRQMLHLLHMNLCGPMRIASINGKRYVLVIVDDYSRYTWVHFLRSKDEAPEVIKTFLKRITVLIQKLDISFLYVFGALCYPKNDHEDIGRLGTKGDIGFFIGYSADSCAYRIYNRRTKKIMETMNVSFNELLAMAFEQRSSKPSFKDHPLEEVIGEPSRPVLIRNQLRSDGDMCMYALTVSTMEPKNVKEAMTDPAWIDSMQEEPFQFKRLDVYVDDIIFGSTHPRYIQLFSNLIKSHFEMSMMREMTFFLGLQVNQSPYGIFINQSKYVLEILRKYGMESCDPVGTPMEIKDKLDLDHNGTPVDATKYHSMIGALMYLTSSRPDIVHATCLCARYQAKPTEKHLKEV